MGAVRFAGYAAIFGRADRGGDVVLPGALVADGAVPLLWQHRGDPIGTVEWLGEDARGLGVIGRIEAEAVARLVRVGALGGLSFGYRATRVRQGAWRTIAAAELIEVSVVARPMQPLARIHAVEDG
ncbi:HK97 family phage prohead protease [Sphingomonas hankookensis]|uniref:HK97 family phage prohead protease n=1 Tax=Sphingomonas hankookensis TaxID=563996 RepID=UPI001F55BA24|nr:HK97 family phage prohead protease [Sphingomonas hankookensis]